MRMLTASALGLALALPFAIASVPAHADSGDFNNQAQPYNTQQPSNNQWNGHHDQGAYDNGRTDRWSAQRADQRPDQYQRDDQQAQQDRGVYGHDQRDSHDQRQAEADQNQRADRYSNQGHVNAMNDRHDQTGAYQANGDQYRHDQQYSQGDRTGYTNDHRDNSDHD